MVGCIRVVFLFINSICSLLQQKIETLDSLMEIEVAYSLLNQPDESGKAVSKIDSHYKKLKAKIRPMSATESEFELFKLYMTNTHAETHRNYELEIVEVLELTEDMLNL